MQHSIVFVHGLQGHPKKTWSYSPTSKDFEDADYLAWYKELKGIPANQPVEAKPAETLQVEPPKKRRFVKSLSRLFSSKGKDKVEGVKDAGAKLQESIYWPAEILAKHIPNARVMTFGYDTHVIGASARNQGTIFSHSRNLLKSLKTTRGNKPDRALILVSHSLGGILVKETLRRSQVDPGEEMQAIFNATIGVIFFGTPHRGSPGWASFGKGVSGVASLILGVEANSEIIRALLPSGKELELGRESFAKQWVERGKSKDLPAFVVRTYQEGTGVTSISRGGLNKKVF
jgi:hypothetical protein